MKKIGIVGGLGPEATIEYYRLQDYIHEKLIRKIYEETKQGLLRIVGYHGLHREEWSEVFGGD